MSERPHVANGTGETVLIGSFGTIYKVLSDATGGSVAVVEHALEPGLLAAPLHRHTHEEEVSYVLEGEVTVQQGADITTAGVSTYVVKPRGMFHTFWNSGSTTLRLIEVIAPGGFERYFRELAGFVPKDGPPDMEGITMLGRRYGLEFDMSSIPTLMERHGLRLG